MTKQELTELVQQWVLLFPEDVRWNGVAIRSEPEDCVNKMQKFIKQYPAYTKDIIFAATKAYLLQQEAKNWEYTRRACYFIDKQGVGSLLAQYCRQDVEGQQHNNLPKQQTLNPNFYNDFI